LRIKSVQAFFGANTLDYNAKSGNAKSVKLLVKNASGFWAKSEFAKNSNDSEIGEAGLPA
jgi:hypothetical protein